MKRIAALVLALGIHVGAHAGDLATARALVEQQRYTDAIAIYDVLVTTRPADADLLIEAARVHAWADRHVPAADLYRRAMAAAPARRDDVLLALAWQLAWQGRHDEAVPLFREVVERIPAQRDEARYGLAESQSARGDLTGALNIYRALAIETGALRARQGEARTLRWLDRHDEAAARYRDILEDHPADPESQLGLARALNHGGRHLAALTAYRAAVEADAARARDTRVERATAYRWAGLEDLALETLGDASGTEADALRARLVQENASSIRVEADSSWDSDELRIRALGVSHQWHLGKHTLDVSAREARIEQNGVTFDGRQLLVKAGTRLGSAEGGFFWPSVSLGTRDYSGWQTTAWKLQGKWVPADRWRLDIEAGNDVVETTTAIGNEVTLNVLAAGADWRFAPGWIATAGAAVLRFDDGNRRTRVISRVERVMRAASPRWTVGMEGIGFTDSDPSIARGYYNPERYKEFKLLTRGEHTIGGWLIEARVALGQLWETPGGRSHLFAWELTAQRELGKMAKLRLNAGGSDSNSLLRTGSGYARNYLGAALIWFY